MANTASSISGLVVEYIVAIDVTRVRFPADASLLLRLFYTSFLRGAWSLQQHFLLRAEILTNSFCMLKASSKVCILAEEQILDHSQKAENA